MNDRDPHEAEMERRLEQQWGPETPMWKRRLLGALMILALVGLVVGALIIAPR
ncbi:MAG: hypothetical protein ACFCUO_02120 [Rhodospirillales bacterium]